MNLKNLFVTAVVGLCVFLSLGAQAQGKMNDHHMMSHTTGHHRMMRRHHRMMRRHHARMMSHKMSGKMDHKM